MQHVDRRPAGAGGPGDLPQRVPTDEALNHAQVDTPGKGFARSPTAIEATRRLMAFCGSGSDVEVNERLYGKIHSHAGVWLRMTALVGNPARHYAGADRQNDAEDLWKDIKSERESI